jgi:hypothetical protein
MGSEVNPEGLRLLFTHRRHFRARNGTIQYCVKCVPELGTDKARKGRGGSGDHITERLVGTIGGYSLSKWLGHPCNILGLNWHAYAKLTEVRLHRRFVDDSCMDTCGTPATGPWAFLLDNRCELKVAWLILIDAASRETWQNHHKQSQEQKRGTSRQSPRNAHNTTPARHDLETRIADGQTLSQAVFFMIRSPQTEKPIPTSLHFKDEFVGGHGDNAVR